jgi:hypothetical protein
LFLEEQPYFVKVELSNGTKGWVFNDQIRSCDSPSGNNNLSDNPLVSPTSQPDNNNSVTNNNNPNPVPDNTTQIRNLQSHLESFRNDYSDKENRLNECMAASPNDGTIVCKIYTDQLSSLAEYIRDYEARIAELSAGQN